MSDTAALQAAFAADAIGTVAPMISESDGNPWIFGIWSLPLSGEGSAYTTRAWPLDLVPQLAARGYGNSEMLGLRVCSFITRRHATFAWHAKLSIGTVVQLIAPDGTYHEMTITGLAQVGTTDIGIFYFGSDLPAAFTPFPLAGPNLASYLPSSFAVVHGSWRDATPDRHALGLGQCSINGGAVLQAYTGYEDYWRPWWVGDSGTGVWLPLTNGDGPQLVLVSHASSNDSKTAPTQGYGPWYANHFDAIAGVCATLDAAGDETGEEPAAFNAATHAGYLGELFDNGTTTPPEPDPDPDPAPEIPPASYELDDMETLQLLIASDSQDADYNVGSSVSDTGSRNRVGIAGGTRGCVLRYTNGLSALRGATILSAIPAGWGESFSGSPLTKIYLVQSAAPAMITTAAGVVTAGKTAGIDFDPVAWPTGQYNALPDISTLLQALIDTYGSISALLPLWLDDGTVSGVVAAQSLNSDPTHPFKIDIEYIPAPDPPAGSIAPAAGNQDGSFIDSFGVFNGAETAAVGSSGGTSQGAYARFELETPIPEGARITQCDVSAYLMTAPTGTPAFNIGLVKSATPAIFTSEAEFEAADCAEVAATFAGSAKTWETWDCKSALQTVRDEVSGEITHVLVRTNNTGTGTNFGTIGQYDGGQLGQRLNVGWVPGQRQRGSTGGRMGRRRRAMRPVMA